MRLAWPDIGVRLVVLAAGLVIGAAGAARSDVTVRAAISSPRATVGEALTLSIDVDGAQDVPALDLGQLQGFTARYIGPSTQISIVNGRVSASVQHRYSLVPLEAGQFTLGPFAIDYGGQHFDTAPLRVEVTAAGSGSQGPAGRPRAPAGNPAAGTDAPTGTGALQLRLAVPKRQVYLHEQLPVTATLYVGSVRVADVQYPTLAAQGWSVDGFAPPRQRQETIDGQTFQVLPFETTVTPLQAGTLTLGPATLQVSVLSRRRGGMFNDPFFDAFAAERHPTEVRAEPVALTVLPLPEAGKPASFSGAVGTFVLEVTAAPTELTAGDPVTLTMRLRGHGNLADATAPSPVTTEGFRTYPAQIGKAAGDAVREYEQVLIPNTADVHQLPPVRFSFFDPDTGRYQTLESQPIALVVRAPAAAPAPEIVAGAGARAPAPEQLGRDIISIKDDPGRLRPRHPQWYGSALWLLWQPVPLLLLAGAVVYDRRRQRLTGDVRYARFTRAGRRARHDLRSAQQALAQGDRTAFYDAVSRTMRDYLGAKLDLPPGAVDIEAVTRRGISSASLECIRELFATCEHVRFAPSGDDGDMRGMLGMAEDVIRRLEREQRRRPPAPPARASSHVPQPGPV